MSLNHRLRRQLADLRQVRERCLQLRMSVADLQQQSDSVAERDAQQLQRLRQVADDSLRMELDRIQREAADRSEQAAADSSAQREAARENRERRLDELEARHREQVLELRQKLQNEEWVLQSVCDETNEDTPVRNAERQHEIHLTQQTFLDEQLKVLDERVQQTSTWLSACHASMEPTLPPVNVEFKGREASRESTLSEIDCALVSAGSLDRLSLPQWVYRWRLWGLALFIFLMVTIVAAATRADLTRYASPELGSPDWEWLGVSALIGAGVSFLLCLILVVIVQSKLRGRFESMLQHVANAKTGSDYWRGKARQELKKLDASAETWKQAMLERREQHARRLHGETDSKISVLNASHREQTSRQAQLFNEQMTSIDAESARQEAAISAWRGQELQRVQTKSRADHDVGVSRIQSASAALKSDLTTKQSAHVAEWTSLVATATELARSSRDAASNVSRWSHLKSAGWKAPTHLPAVLPVGDLLASIPASPADAHAPDLTSNLCFELPALLTFPTDTSIVIEHDAAGREPALEFIRAILLRLLTSIMPGRVQFTLIDPVGLGQSFSALMHLADFDELLISNRIWTDATQIRDRLQKVTEHMESVFQTYLRSDFETIEEYNAAAGEVAEPYHFVVIAGFPASFTEEAARALTSILTSGPRCGVHAIIAWSPDQPLPRSFDAANLRNCCVPFKVVNGRVSADNDPIEFDVLAPPSAADYVQLVRMIGEQSRHARRVEVAFTRIAPKPTDVWTHSSADGIDFPIGRAGAARLQYMRLGRGTSQHVLVAGKTGSGKSTLLHILITNLALHYSPDEIQFFLIDFKKGVEFRTYAANQLPHARVVAIESDREFGLSVLERLDEILQERGELFRVRGVQDVPSFRKQFRNESMPRLLLLIDEFQEFFTSEDRVSSRASLLMDRLIRQGRAFGIHVLLGSQTLGGAYSLARSTLGQVAVRIALQCSESDAHLILSEENSAARLLTRPGEAIYNDANGMVEGNHPFQIAWLEESQRETLIESMIARPDARQRRDGRMIVFEGNVPPTIDQCAPLAAWLKQDTDATRHFVDAVPAWIGEPVAIAAPVSIEFRRSGGQNVLIVGQEGDLADTVLASLVVSWATGNRGTSQMTLLHDDRDRASRQKFAELFDATIAPRLTNANGVDADAVIAQFMAQLTERESGVAPADCPELLLAIRNIGQFRSLRREDDDYGLSGFGTPKTASAASQLGDLIRRGPAVGIHVLVWADTFSNAMRWLSNSLLREFDNRIAFRLNQTDSASLIDTPVAASLTQGRAILYRDQTGTADRFRPFSWPDAAWLRAMTATAAGEVFNIDELVIE